jgi:undecaprenyl diphosphate synthase
LKQRRLLQHEKGIVARKYNLPTPPDKKLQDELREHGPIPTHIAIIMDGNGRWAKERGLHRVAGHRQGVNSVRDIVEVCGQLGVKYLTIYAFSTENWRRPKEEVSTLMRLLLKALHDETDRLHENNVRLTCIGDINALPQQVQDELFGAMEKTRGNTGLTLNLALSYSGRWDITQGVRRLAEDVERHRIKAEHITEKTLSAYLTTKGMPDPDLLIRTSGEFRISNFLLWQLAYTEIYISDRYWPEFRRGDLYEAIRDFQRRERRFGMVSEQLRKSGIRRSVERIIRDAAGV